MSENDKDQPFEDIFRPEARISDHPLPRVPRPEPNRPRLLYKSSEAQRALDVGETKFWELVNHGTLDARRIGRRVYITAESLEAYVADLPRAITPTMAKTERAAREAAHDPRLIAAKSYEPDRAARADVRASAAESHPTLGE